jgi:hypothetical protein
MNIKEIKRFRELTTGGYTPFQLQEVSIDGIKKFRNSWNQPAESPTYGGYWDPNTWLLKHDDPLGPIYGRKWEECFQIIQ